MVRISRSLLDAVLARAAASADEVCGLLLGSVTLDQAGGDVLVEAAVACANVHPTPASHFEIDPAALLAAHRAARAGGAAVVGHYHSHPSGRAEPSATDAAMAAADGAIWLILADGRAAAWRAVVDGAWLGRFDPVEIAMSGACAGGAASS